jgi:hypothetical protein
MITIAYKKVFDCIQYYLVYHSVLQRLAKALKKVEQSNIGHRLSGHVCDRWATFKAAAAESLDLKAEYKAARKIWTMEPGCFGCEYPDVSHPYCCH